MALDIWTTDPDNKPKPRKVFVNDTVARLHSGYMEPAANGKKAYPVALSEWRVSTGDMTVASAVGELLGGTPVENEESPNENFIDVYTEAASIEIIVDPGGLTSDMKQWSNGKLIHHCTGTVFLSHPLDAEKVGEACGCPKLFAERKEAAKNGMGPDPDIRLNFRLADDANLGLMYWKTGSWTLAKVLHEVENDLERVGDGGPVLVRLELEEVSYVAKKGKMKGTTVEYTKPNVRVLKSLNDAIAD